MLSIVAPSFFTFREMFRNPPDAVSYISSPFAPLRKRGHRYVGLVVTFLAERHYAVDQRKERVVLADADIVARVVHRTALADEDVARFGNLTAEEFYSQSLTFRFATVLGTTDSFLMCHFSSFLVVKH